MLTSKQLLQEAIEEIDKGNINKAAQLTYSASIRLAEEAMGTKSIRIDTSYFQEAMKAVYDQSKIEKVEVGKPEHFPTKL